MKKTLVLLIALLLLVPQVCAAETGTALRFGSGDPIYSIYASYEIEAGITDVKVTFADQVKNYAYSNFVNGKLWISVASVDSLDLSKPIGYVMGKTASGKEIAPELVITSLSFNGEAAKGNLVFDSVQATLNGNAMRVIAKADDHFLGSYTLVVSAYDTDGKMLNSYVMAADFEKKQERFTADLAGCVGASYVKAFFLSSEYRPVTMAKSCEISK